MAETPLPPWLTRQYDYATGLRQIGQTVASNLQRNRALEIQAQSAQAQQQSAAALEQWRIAQAKALQDKQTQEAADAAEQTLADQQLEVDLSKATDMESRMRAYLRRGVKSKNPNFAQYAQEERLMKQPRPTNAFDQREEAFKRLQGVVTEREQDEERQKAGIAARDIPMRNIKEIEPDVVTIPKGSILKEEFLREQAGMPRTKAAAEDKFTDRERQEMIVLRSEKSRLEKLSTRTKLNEEEEDALIGINRRIAELTRAQGLDMTKAPKQDKPGAQPDPNLEVKKTSTGKKWSLQP